MSPATESTLKPLRELYFIRHGETGWSLSGRHTGRTEIPLTPHGGKQARELGLCRQMVGFSRVLTSSRQCARQTCELAGLAPPAEIDADISEWDYGDYERRTTAEIRVHRPGWNVYRDGCPGGETPAQVSDRADRVIANLATAEGKIALFSHGQFGCALAARWIGLPVNEGQHFSLGPASLNILGHSPGHPEIAIIARLNGTR